VDGRTTLGEFDNLDGITRDLDLFGRIYRYLDDKPDSSFREIAENLGGGLNAQKISTFIEQLEARMGGERLIDRKPKSKKNSLTPAATLAYRKGVNSLETLRSWPQRERDVIRIGAPNLLIQLVLPKIMPPYREHLSGSDTDVRIMEHPELDVVVENVVNSQWDCALVWLHEDKLRHNSYLKEESRIVLEEDYFGLDFEVMMICPPRHKFVELARNAYDDREPRGSWKLNLAWLKDELLYVLPAQRQPLYGLIPPPPADPLKRVVQDTYMAIISMVRCHVHQGIGLVPSVILPELNEMRRNGQLFHAPVFSSRADEPRLKMKIGCVTRKGVEHLRAPVRAFFEVARAKLREISMPDYSPAIRQLLPDSIDQYINYNYCYFVMQDQITFGVPGWCRGDLRWGQKVSEVGIRGVFRAATDQPRDFEVDAQLRKGNSKFDRIFQFIGIGKPHNNTIICTFNMGVYDQETGQDAVVGVWSGRSDDGLATVAPMVLSRAPLEFRSVKRIVDKVSSRYLPNADVGDSNGRFAEVRRGYVEAI
jgi:DNA-binding transcriptional LysR family regulator